MTRMRIVDRTFDDTPAASASCPSPLIDPIEISASDERGALGDPIGGNTPKSVRAGFMLIIRTVRETECWANTTRVEARNTAVRAQVGASAPHRQAKATFVAIC